MKEDKINLIYKYAYYTMTNWYIIVSASVSTVLTAWHDYLQF